MSDVVEVERVDNDVMMTHAQRYADLQRRREQFLRMQQFADVEIRRQYTATASDKATLDKWLDVARLVHERLDTITQWLHLIGPPDARQAKARYRKFVPESKSVLEPEPVPVSAPEPEPKIEEDDYTKYAPLPGTHRPWRDYRPLDGYESIALAVPVCEVVDRAMLLPPVTCNELDQRAKTIMSWAPWERRRRRPSRRYEGFHR